MGTALALWRAAERFNPNQPRDSRGRWSDAGLHIDDLERLYGTPLDEVEFADGSYVTAYPSGITVNFDEGDEQFSTVAEDVTPGEARKLADRVVDMAGRSAEYDEDEDGPAGPNGLVDWSERDGWLVGYYPHGDGVKVGRAVGDGRFDDFDLELGEAAMFAAGLKDMADRLERETTEGGMLTALALWRTAERFDPDQPRDAKGRWTDGTPGPDPKVDRLKLHGRIPLGPGERLVSSSKTEVESGTIRSAVTDTEFGRSIRLGIGSKGFGSASVGRETGEPVWDGGPGLSVDDFARNEADLRARNEEEVRLSNEWHTATGERQDEIDRRLQELDEMPGRDLYRSGATVRLDEEAVADLRSRVDSALTVVERLEADVQALLDEDPDPDAEVDDVFRARLRQIYADHGLDLSAENSHIFGQGAVYGEWGTLRYEVEWEWNSGWRPRLFVAVEPRGAEGWEIGGENDAYASLELGEARKWLRDLGKQMDSTRESLHSGGTMTTALDIWRAVEKYNPSQPRGHDGKWTDGPSDGLPAGDAMDLADRIDDLHPGERFLGSDSLGGNDDDTALLAWTSTPDGPEFRFGLVPSSGAFDWTAAHDGSTAILDREALEGLRQRLRSAMESAAAMSAELHAQYDRAYELKQMSGLPQLDQQVADEVIPGSKWADIGLSAWTSDTPGDFSVTLTIQPGDEGLTGSEATFGPDEVVDLVDSLDIIVGAKESIHSGGTLTTDLALWRATEGRKGFNPSQPRGGDGKWVDRGGARRAQVAASIAAMQNPHPDWAHAGQPDAPWRQGTAGGPAKTPVASAAGGNRHVAHLEGLKSREDAEAYVAGVKGAELEELRKATGVKRGSAASVRQAIVAQTVGSRVDAQTSLGSSGGFGWGDPDAMAGFKPSAPAAPAKKAMPAKKAAPGRTKATGKSADDHLSALSGMSREDAAAYVAALPGKELDEIIAKLPTAVRGRTLAAKRDAIVGGTAGFRADAAGTSGTSTAVLSATDRTGIGDGSFKLGSWADTAEPAAGKPRKRAPRKKAS